MHRTPPIALLLGLLCAGCRPDPGRPVYIDDAQVPPQRLKVGAFYSDPTTDSILIDDSTRRLDVFNGTLSAITEDDRDLVDGQPSFALVHAGTASWGMGIDWDQATDLSRWKAMHVSFKSSSATFAEFQIGMASGGQTYSVQATAYGYKADGAWHALAIPVADFVMHGFDPAQTRAAFVIGGGAGKLGDALKVAELFFDVPEGT